MQAVQLFCPCGVYRYVAGVAAIELPSSRTDEPATSHSLVVRPSETEGPFAGALFRSRGIRLYGWADPMAFAETEGGVEYEPRALDQVERHFWRDIWETVPAEVAAEHGIELRDFGPVQVTADRRPAARWAC